MYLVSIITFLIPHHHKPALGTLLYLFVFSFFIFPECYPEYLGTEPTLSSQPSLMICHCLVSFGFVFSLMIDLLGRETQCKRNKLVLSLIVSSCKTNSFFSFIFSFPFFFLFFFFHTVVSTTLAKKIGTATRQRAKARDLSSMHAPVVDVRACFNFFAQGSRFCTENR